MKKSIALAAAATVGMGALLAPVTAAHAATDAIYLGGTGTGTQLQAIFGNGGSGKAYADVFVPDLDQLNNVVYNGSPVANPHWAVPKALEAINAADDPAVVLGMSKGAQVARATEAKDTKADTRYVLVGDPDDRHGVSRTFGLSAPEKEFTHDVEIITDEWDGVGRMPDRPNPIAYANALAGWAFVHPHYGDGTKDDPLTRLDDADVTVTKNPNGTTTTRKVIRNSELPLLKPLRDTERTLTRGRDDLTDRIERDVVKPLVKAGYSDYDKKKPAKKSTKTEAKKAEASTSESKGASDGDA